MADDECVVVHTDTEPCTSTRRDTLTNCKLTQETCSRSWKSAMTVGTSVHRNVPASLAHFQATTWNRSLHNDRWTSAYHTVAWTTVGYYKCITLADIRNCRFRAGLRPNWAWCCCPENGLFSSRHSRQTKTPSFRRSHPLLNAVTYHRQHGSADLL